MVLNMENNPDEWIYPILVQLRISGSGAYHSLNSAYLQANSLIVAALSFLFGSVNDTRNLIVFISLMGVFLCIQMKLAQERFRAINTSYAERLKKIEQRNDKIPPIFLDTYRIEKNKKLSEELEKKYYHKRWIRWGKCFLGGRMKLLPYVFFIIYVGFIAFTYWDEILLFLDP